VVRSSCRLGVETSRNKKDSKPGKVCYLAHLYNVIFRLPNLRRLFLSDNQIHKIEGLEGNTRLEELILEENYISKLEGLTSLANLTRLDLGMRWLGNVFT
jgi:hypothetical protein